MPFNSEKDLLPVSLMSIVTLVLTVQGERLAVVAEELVRNFQASVGVPSDGVVRTSTRKKLSARMLTQHASWYGPGFFGNTTACGQTLTKKTVGVAHKKLPCERFDQLTVDILTSVR